MNIREVSERTGLSPDTLRWYEKAGLLAPVRKKGGKRDYSEREVRWIGYVKCMRKADLPVEAIAEYIRLYREGSDATRDRRRAILADHYERLRRDLEERRQALEYLRLKIDWFDGRVSDVEEALRLASAEALAADPELPDEAHSRLTHTAPSIRHPNG